MVMQNQKNEITSLERVVGLEFVIIKEGKVSLLIIESTQFFTQIGVLRPPSETRLRPP